MKNGLVWFCRIAVGLLFIFSGLIKINDPLGFSYKLEEYFEVFHMTFLNSFALGLAIVLCALEMILGFDIFKADKDTKTGNIVPIAFPIIAGSGTLTTIVSLKAAYHQYNILIGILINLVIVFICLRSINFIEKLLGPSGIAVVRKFFGVILLAIAVKIFKANMSL